MVGRLFALFVVVPLIIYCIVASLDPLHIEWPYNTLAALACVFFTYETYCLMDRAPGKLFGYSEQDARLFATNVLCGWLVLCAYKLKVKSNVPFVRLFLGFIASILVVYEGVCLAYMEM